MAPLDKILKGLKQQLQPDLLDEQQRQQEIETAVEKYLKKWGKTSNPDELYHSLNKLAERLTESGLDSLPLFKLAWEKNQQDKVLLLKVAKELFKRGVINKESIHIYRSAAEVEPNKFPLLECVANYYRENNFLYELMLVDEQIVDTFEEYEKIMQNGSEDEKLKLVDVEWVKAGKLYEQAKQELLPLYLMVKRKDKRAMALYRKALEEDPENIEILELLIDALLQQKCTDPEALEIYEYYLAYKPDSCEVILLLSQGYRSQNRQSEAIALLEAHFRAHPKDVQCLEEIVNYYLQQPETTEQTITYFKAYLKNHPQNIEILKRVAEFYADIQQCDAEAIEYYRRYLPHTKEPARFLSLIAHYSFRNERWHEAIDVFEKLYKSGQREKNVVLPLASCYAFCERRDAQAVLLYEEAFRLGTDNNRIKELLSESFVATNRLGDIAQRCFLETLQANPQHLMSRLGLAKIYFQRQDYLAAAKEAINILLVEPEHQSAQQLLSKCLILQPDDDLLISKLDTLPEDTRYQVYLIAFQQNPQLKKITIGLANYFLKRQRNDRLALQVYRAARQFSPANIQLLNMLALANYAQQEFTEAVNIDKQIFSICHQTCILKEHLPASKKAICTEVCLRLARVFVEKKITDSSADLNSIFRFAYRRGFIAPELVSYLASSIIQQASSTPEDLQILDIALSNEPQRKDILNYLLKAYLELGKPDSVVNLCLQYLKTDNTDTQVLNWLIECLSQYPVSNAQLESLLEEAYCDNPTIPELTIALALLYGRLHHYDATTLRIFERAAQLRPDNSLLQIYLARNYEKLGHYQKAIFIYQRIFWSIPDDAKIIEELALAYLKAEAKGIQVLNVVEQALKLNPENIDLSLYKLRLLFELGKQENALKYCEELHSRIGNKLPLLINILEKVVSSAPETPSPVMARLATLLIETGNIEAAIKYLEVLTAEYQVYLSELLDCYTKILQQNPEHIFARIERAILYRLIEDYESSVRDLESIIEYAESTPSILFELAETYEAWAKKEKNTQRKLDILYKLGRLYFRLNEYDQCITVYQNILHLDKLSQEALLYIAQCFYRKNVPELALQYCKRLEKTEEVKALLYELGDVFYARHNLAGAAEAFNEIVNADISFRDAALKLTEVQKELQGGLLSDNERQSIMGELSAQAQRRFDLREEIGRGAWSIVIKAYDRELDEIVALKILPARISDDPAMIELFKNEARLARRLSHPKIVRIYDIGEEAARKYISMEYIPGRSLRAILDERRYLPPLEVIFLSLQIADALSYAHSQGVLHRDIKPANILVTADKMIKITDFGIAAVIAQPGKLSREIYAGTPLYMAPEQIEGLPCTPATDLYSFGVVMYEMLNGSPPFKAGNIAYHHLFTKPPALKNVPQPMADIVYRCLEKKPEARYRNAKEIIDALKQAREVIQNAAS